MTAEMTADMITLTSYEEARDGFRHRDLRQALYDDGHQLMTGVIVNLHGADHVARRRLENRLFRRDTFAWYETVQIPQIIDSALSESRQTGRGDLLPIARRTMMRLSIDVAGVDVEDRSFDRFYELMERLSRASIVAHATGDRDTIKADGERALDAFRDEFYQGSLERRRDLVARFERGEIGEDDLPRDVLTTLLRNQDSLELSDVTVLREIAYYPWVGSHSTSGQLVHAMHHIFDWLDERPDERSTLVDDDDVRQRFVHESMRLHPASPVAMRVAVEDVVLKTGRQIPKGATVCIDVQSANRDAEAAGPRADEFDPNRRLADGVPPWGLSFGTGTHACLGQELAGGLAPDPDHHHHLLGAVALMAGKLLAVGARRDPENPPTADNSTTRPIWGTYPVVFVPELAVT